jgi:hypothetical protein
MDEDDGVFYENGKYNLYDDIIELTTDNKTSYYKFEGDKIRLLDYRKKKITGELADMYILKKTKGCN